MPDYPPTTPAIIVHHLLILASTALGSRHVVRSASSKEYLLGEPFSTLQVASASECGRMCVSVAACTASMLQQTPTGPLCHLYAYQCQGRDPIELNLAYKRTCWMSSTYNSNTICDRALDGLRGANIHTVLDENPWVMIDLGSIRDIQIVQITNRNDDYGYIRLHDLYIGTRSTSADEAPVTLDFPVCASHVPNIPAGLVKAFRCEARARYVILQIRAQEFLHVSEIEVY